MRIGVRRMDQAAEPKIRGWLANKARRERRDNPNTLTDEMVMRLLTTIDTMPKYSGVGDDDLLIRLRDKAIIAILWTYIKRGKEILTLKVCNIDYDDKQLSVTFRVEKKAKHYRICSDPTCKARNAVSAKHCKRCDLPLPEEVSLIQGESNVYTLSKTLQFQYTTYIVAWLKTLKILGAKPSSYLFPRYNIQAHGFLWNKCMTVQRLDQILQKLDPTMSSHFFRYGNAEKYKRLGYSEDQIAEIAHMDSKTVKIYLKRKGLTDAQQTFSEDIR
jgi:integrase